MSLLMNIKMTALARYNAHMEGDVEPEPIERLRFFLSLAITGQDWLDVEQFIDGVSNQLAMRDAEIAELKRLQVAYVIDERDELREQVDTLRGFIFRTAAFCRIWGGEAERARKMLEEALAATAPKEIPE